MLNKLLSHKQSLERIRADDVTGGSIHIRNSSTLGEPL